MGFTHSSSNNNNRNNTVDFVVDRISDLPDSILGHILSLIPTANAVATSILSKRWKLVWVSIYNLEFYNFKDVEEEEIKKFVLFVNRVLCLIDAAGWLNKFSLTCHPLSISRPLIILWIDAAIARNVHHLNLSAGNIHMPARLLSNDSLRSLDLYGIISIYGISAVSLPKLVTLKIDRVRFESEQHLETLIKGCPILRYLNLKILSVDKDEDITCTISSTSLRRLEISFVNPSKLKLKASNLEYLRLCGVFEVFVEESLSSLVEADLEIVWFLEYALPNNSIVEAVRAFDCAESLTLSTGVMLALSRGPIRLSTEFKRLVKLEAYTYCRALQDIIQNSENLEDLLIYTNPHRRARTRWTPPVEVPKCLSNSLKRVRLQGYKCNLDAHEMIRYILLHGRVLEVMEIISCVERDGDKQLVLRQISKFPIKSPACKVQFNELPSRRELKLLPH